MTSNAAATIRRVGIAHEAKASVYSLGIAELRVVCAPEQIRTVLGSCIGVALYDRHLGVGGMAHVMLPDSTQGQGQPGKFADTAVDLLLKQVLAEGAERSRLRVKIAGGAAMFGDASTGTLGNRNAEAVRERLRHHALRVAASALGGTKGRKMMLNPATGEVSVEIIGQPAEII